MIKMGNPIHHKWVNCSLFTSRLTFIILFKCVVKLMHRASISILYHGHSSVNLGISEQKKKQSRLNGPINAHLTIDSCPGITTTMKNKKH